MGRTYRKFIDKGLNIYINGNKVKTIDPSFLSLKNSRFPDDEPGELVQEITIDWPVDKSKAKPGETAPIIIRITKSPLMYREGSGVKNQNIFKKIYENSPRQINRR